MATTASTIRRIRFSPSDSLEYRKAIWNSLENSINKLVNAVTVNNLESTVVELGKLDINAGMGLFCKACIRRQIQNPDSTDLMAGFIAAVNAKFPDVGDLLCKRVIIQFDRALKKNIKLLLVLAAKFVAPLVNLSVLDGNTVLQMLMRLALKPMDGSLEVCVQLIRECGWAFEIRSPEYMKFVFDTLSKALSVEGVDMKVRLMIEDLLEAKRRNAYMVRNLPDELDVIDIDDQVTHSFGMGPDPDDEDVELNMFETHPLFRGFDQMSELVKILSQDYASV